MSRMWFAFCDGRKIPETMWRALGFSSCCPVWGQLGRVEYSETGEAGRGAGMPASLRFSIHSAKGQEWDVVYILNVVDGCIPSDMATGSKEEIEEERRLLYVAMTRARDQLFLIQPHRFYTGASRRNGDRHIYAPRTRFIPDDLLRWFEKVAAGDFTSTNLDNLD